MVALGGYGDRKPSELSGGQRQRVALARALVNEPKALLLDEPLGALDLKLREQMQEELKSLQRSLGITFIFVTHDQGEALSMADRVAVFNEGKIIQVGAPEDIYYRPECRLWPISWAPPTSCPRDFVARLTGMDAHGAVRPEAVHLADEGHARRSKLSAFWAPSTRVDAGQGVPMTMLLPKGARIPKTGETIHIEWGG